MFRHRNAITFSVIKDKLKMGRKSHVSLFCTLLSQVPWELLNLSM